VDKVPMTAKDLANLIERTGLSQREFGLKVNLSHVTIQNYLKNKRKITEEIEKQIKVALGQSGSGNG
jgi:transcriptional regulator with XRE-family HTH domain